MLRAFFIAGVVTQPELHVVLAPTAKEVVKPAAARVAAGQVRRLAQAACPELGVEFMVAQVVGVQKVEAAQGEVVEQFPKDGRERLVADFLGRK